MTRGSAKRLPALAVTVFLGWTAAFSASAPAADKAGCTDPSWAPERLPGFAISSCEDKAWVPVPFDLTGGGRKMVEGRRSTVEYALTDKSKDPTNETARRYYAEQGQKAGAKLMSDPNGGWSATLTKTTSGWRIELAATGLPHRANGRYYQAWLKNAAGILVPVGTFNDAEHVTLWSGVPVTQFRTLTVTQQQANGDPASSGRRVLVGTIRAAH